MDIEEDIVANAKKLLIQEWQLLDLELNAIEYGVIGVYDLYFKIKCRNYHQI